MLAGFIIGSICRIVSTFALLALVYLYTKT